MDNTDIQKQLQFRRLMSQIHGFVKLNFASSLKKRIFATSFNRKERPRESAFSLFRRRELGHFTKVQRRNKAIEFSLVLYSYSNDIRQVELHQQTLSSLYQTKGSPSPTSEIREMDGSTFFVFVIFTEP